MSRFVILAAALILAAGSAHAAGRQKQQDGDVLLLADQVVYDADRHIIAAQGHVEVDRDGRILMCDKLDYDQDKDVMTASGHVSLMDAKGNVAFASSVVLTDKMRDGALKGFAALIGRSGRLAATSAQRNQDRFTTAWHAAYTPCKICDKPGQRTPVWRIKAYRVVHDQLKHRIRFKDATIEAFGVPILYTPYMSEPDPTVRYSSGLLLPDFGSSSTIGYFIRLPIYVSLSPSQDATIEPLITSHGGDVLEGEYRERWMNGGMWLQGSFGFNPNGGVSLKQDQVYSDLFGSGRTPIDNVWSTGFDVQVSSDQTFLKRYDISFLDRLTSDLFLQGESGRSRFAVTGYFFQGLRSTDDNRTFPVPLPLIEYSYIPQDHLLGGQFRLDLSSVALTRDIGTDEQRVSAEVRWRKPWITANGMMITLQADARGDVYHIDNETPLPPSGHYVERGLPYIALDWSWPFVSEGENGRAFVLEPIAQIIGAPYGGNPKNLPDEDSVAFELDENNVFSFDQVPGYDIVDDGPRATAGVRADAIFPIAHLEAVVGETYRLKAEPILGSDSGLSEKSSDIVARFSIKFPPYIDLTHRIDFDQDSGTVRRNEVYLLGTYGRTAAEVSYVQLAPSAALGLGAREEINAQFDVNLFKYWQAFAAVQRDLIAGEMINTEYGLGYEDECLAIALAYRRKYTSELSLPPSTAVILHIGLKTGDQDVKPFSLFHQDIFTYNRP
ncbi:MAG: LPS-assembly protein LptD [Alphaproteobacteria bacterium]|nr:LPS-assembly protein LptD [Alphaproteobacteria bacterium]